MNISRHYGLAGKFKFDVFTKTNELKSSTDFIDNFITNTGMEYVKNFAYADCFRYLSLGSGTAQNSITINEATGTTGLNQPIPDFMYIGGNLSNSQCNGGAVDNAYVAKGCGYRIEPTGVTLLRSWRVPRLQYDGQTHVDTFFDRHWVFKEYMITPGTSGMFGWYDTSKLTRAIACDCTETVYDDSDEPIYGKEAPDFHLKYPSVCDSTGAFTRIIKDITVAPDEYLVVTYALTVGIYNATGNRYFQVSVNHPAPPSTPGPVYNWANGVSVSGYSSLIHPGIKLINNGDVTAVAVVDQIESYSYRLGESFIPPLGIAMEPSCPDTNLKVYITNNNLQFRVNESGGPTDLGAYHPHNPVGRVFPSGLITFHKDFINETSPGDIVRLGDNTSNLPFFYRPRTDHWNDSNQYASQTNYSVATNVGSDDLLDTVPNADLTFNFTPKHFEPYTLISKQNLDSVMSSRSRSQTISMQFRAQETLSNSTGIPIRACVYAYVPDGNSDAWLATLDGVFIPRLRDIKHHFSPSTGTKASLTYERPEYFVTGSSFSGHYWMDESNILQLRYKLTWSSPCPNTVEGC